MQPIDPQNDIKSTISGSTNSTWVTLFYNNIGKFVYTLFATTYSLTRVVTMKGLFRISGKISLFIKIKGVTKDNVAS